MDGIEGLLPPPPPPTFKIILAGDSQVGKTTFLKYLTHGTFTESQKPTVGAKVHTLTLSTTRGLIRFSIWDTAGREELAGLGSGYYTNAKAAILMYSLTDVNSSEKLAEYHKEIVKVCGGDIPIVLCANKSDIYEGDKRLGDWMNLRFQRRNGITHYRMSVNTGEKVERPLLGLAKALMGDAKLKFTRPPLLTEGLQGMEEGATMLIEAEKRMEEEEDWTMLDRVLEWSGRQVHHDVAIPLSCQDYGNWTLESSIDGDVF
ncbi:hypothetical protein AA313_de0206010 [Arthrobotrys entomopaga]|nr:hypothetical protein AA313_de0206010 [Arthrobotrys entomopaga]